MRGSAAFHDPSVNQYAGIAEEWGTPWPNLDQVCRVERRRIPWHRGQPAGETRKAVVYYITSAPLERVDARELMRKIRGHWDIENKRIGILARAGIQLAKLDTNLPQVAEDSLDLAS